MAERVLSDAPARQIDPEQEVRLAVVLYGGVSLAIYMYGIAEEFLHLVRATAPKVSGAAGPAPGELAFPEPESTEVVYRKLGSLLPLADGAGTDGPVRTRFVVDIISGTSAGGINGVCLAKALANGTTLAGLKRLWLTEGDIGVLVNDPVSILDADTGQEIPGLRYTSPPRSLLNSDRMLMRLVRALGEMDAAPGSEHTPLVDELDLWVTATDLQGLELPIQLRNALVQERRYANRHHFRYSPQDDANDFDADANGFLAFASRCTSSFPFAFPPMTLNHLANFPGQVKQSDWSRFYRDYTGASPEFAGRSFSDGGILDNKPFSYATDSLVRRRAVLPVDRKLIFVEPDPAVSGGAPRKGLMRFGRLASAGSREWNALTVSQAAVLGIPRAEAIRRDIQAVVIRNRQIQRVRELLLQVGGEADERAKIQAVAAEVPAATWGGKWLSETIRDGDWGPSYGTYHRLKVRGVVDYLAELVVRAAGLDLDSDDLVAVHYLVRAWKDAHYTEERAHGRQPENQLLLDFGLPYRWRRAAFVLDKMKQLRSRDSKVVTRVFAGCGIDRGNADRSELSPVLQRLMPLLVTAQDVLYAADAELAARDGEFASTLRSLGFGRRELAEILERRTDAEMAGAAKDVLERVGSDEFAQATATAAAVIKRHTAEATQLVKAALGPHVSRRARPEPNAPLEDAVLYALRFYYDAFEAYDLLLYPLEYGTQMAETNPVDVVRISPRDATLPEGVPPEARALRGAAINHFGAFFELEWREHDMLWGRLNAAECLIRALLPEQDARAVPLIEEAHEIIARDFFGSSGNAVERLRRYNPPLSPARPPTVEVLERAAAVTGALVGGIFGGDASGAARRIAPAWSALRAAMRPNPGGWRAVANVLRVLWASRPFKLAVGVWAAPVAAGIGLLVAGSSTRAAGAVLAGIFLALAAAGVGALWFAVAKIRRTIEARVGAMIFSTPDDGHAPPHP